MGFGPSAVSDHGQVGGGNNELVNPLALLGLTRPNTQAFREKTQKVFGTAFKGERKRVAETLEAVTTSLRDELNTRLNTGRKKIETIVFTEVATREKETSQLYQHLSNLESKIIESFQQIAKEQETALENLNKKQDEAREKFYKKINKLNDQCRTDITKIADDVDTKIDILKRYQENENQKFSDKLDRLKNDLKTLDSNHKKQSHNWRNSAENRFDDVLKLVKDSVKQMKENQKKTEEITNFHEKCVKELSAKMKAEKHIREAYESSVKAKLEDYKDYQRHNFEKLKSCADENHKNQARRISEEGQAVKFLQDKFEETMKDIEKQLKVEQLSREETSGKYDNAFMEVKETIEAIQWILTETMRITSDQQILSKRQQIRMKNLEKQQNNLQAQTTDVEMSDAENLLLSGKLNGRLTPGGGLNSRPNTVNTNFNDNNINESFGMSNFANPSNPNFTQMVGELIDNNGKGISSGGEFNLKLTKEEKKILKKLLKEKSTVSKAMKILNKK